MQVCRNPTISSRAIQLDYFIHDRCLCISKAHWGNAWSKSCTEMNYEDILDTTTHMSSSRMDRWLSMGEIKFVKQCNICQIRNGVSQNTRFYTMLHVPKTPWKDVAMDFVHVLRITHHDFVVVFVHLKGL